MGLAFIWDTNTVIYYLQRQFPIKAEQFIDRVLENNQPAIFIITEIELLCWRATSEESMIIVRSFISRAVIYDLDESIKLRTIEVRKGFKLKLPDAIIAASALVKDHVLITRNISDFQKIPGLKLIDPFLSN